MIRQRLTILVLAIGLFLHPQLGLAGASNQPPSTETNHVNAAKSARDHWAFQAPRRPLVPQVTQAEWPRTPVDNFILARLEKERLSPAPEADRITLLRRLSLDLLGLPPSLEEVDAFLADNSTNAWERQVERLLASPHYGERWARQWLDAARYADSNGYEKDRAREMWHYRDWVIRSLNADLPYDRFIVEQVAGDLLPDATQDQIVATGFFRNSMINEEGAIDPEQFRMEAMFDRMDCLGKAVLGLTIQCAQCHDHKYDPLKQEEYYRLFAFLNDVDEWTAPFYDTPALTKLERVRRQLQEAEAELKRAHPDWPQRLAAWEESVGREPVEWVQPQLLEYGDPGGLSKLQLQRDQSLLAGGHRFSGGTWRVIARTTLTNITAVRLEALANANLPMSGPGRSGNGMFALREFSLRIAPLSLTPSNQVKIGFAQATADYEQAATPPGKSGNVERYGPVKFAIDGDEKSSWTIDAGPGRRNVDRKAVFQATTNFGFAGGTELVFSLSCQEEIACFRLSLTTATNAVADPLPRQVREALKLPREQRTTEQNRAVFSYWRSTVPEFQEANARIEKLWKEYPEASGSTLALHARRERRETALLKRGDWLKPTEPVTPGVPAFLHPLPEQSGDGSASRLALARWLVDRRSPTTARVFVNRIWQAYFGEGLVTTPEDFGKQASAPNNPELLDWLASEFMEPQVRSHEGEGQPQPWSLKHLHRLLANSATYRQSSQVSPALSSRDPFNRLLARGPRFRVEGEGVRDIALFASGLLNPKVGGPSIYAPAPAFLFVPPTSYDSFPWKDEQGPERYRRALYTFRRRSTPYPMLQNFDTPNGDAACVRRARSNTPLQALTTLNEPLFVECARALSRTILQNAGTNELARVQYGFRRVTSRSPTEREQTELLTLLRRQKDYLGEGWANVRELATGSNAIPAELPPGSTPTQLAAYTVLARVLLNLDETITKE